MIGKLQRVPLRTVWKHEARDFTTWLQENIDILNEVLNLNLDNVEREQSAGRFSVDLVAEDESSHTVIIENQLEKSDHDHLGKLITYLSSFDAVAAIWIVAEPRPEHINAINWLNESSAADFYLVKVEAVKIGDSPPAPLLTLIVGPSEEVKQVGEAKKDLAERHHIRLRFWEELLHQANRSSNLFSNISPAKDSWISAGSGKSGITYNYNIHQHGARVELYFSSSSQAENKAAFDKLIENKVQIEATFGQPLDWHRLDNRKASRISFTLSDGGYRDEEEWPEVQANMIDIMSRLEKAMKPHIRNL
jgi:hypothetical protein